MSDLIYRQAVTEDGEPVAVTEPAPAHPDSPFEFHGTRPRSCMVILPGDTVNWYDRFGDLDGLTYPAVVITVGTDYVIVGLDDGSVISPTIEVTKHDGTLADLTLVCGEPSELRKQNPAWRWD